MNDNDFISNEVALDPTGTVICVNQIPSQRASLMSVSRTINALGGRPAVGFQIGAKESGVACFSVAMTLPAIRAFIVALQEQEAQLAVEAERGKPE